MSWQVMEPLALAGIPAVAFLVVGIRQPHDDRRPYLIASAMFALLTILKFAHFIQIISE